MRIVINKQTNKQTNLLTNYLHGEESLKSHEYRSYSRHYPNFMSRKLLPGSPKDRVSEEDCN